MSEPAIEAKRTEIIHSLPALHPSLTIGRVLTDTAFTEHEAQTPPLGTVTNLYLRLYTENEPENKVGLYVYFGMLNSYFARNDEESFEGTVSHELVHYDCQRECGRGTDSLFFPGVVRTYEGETDTLHAHYWIFPSREIAMDEMDLGPLSRKANPDFFGVYGGMELRRKLRGEIQ